MGDFLFNFHWDISIDPIVVSVTVLEIFDIKAILQGSSGEN